jgi:ubiquinone/menaquinone biosynthesis C-methylase UbiE
MDVGCGTGTLAIAAKQHVGPEGEGYGIDASPEMMLLTSEGPLRKREAFSRNFTAMMRSNYAI